MKTGQAASESVITNYMQGNLFATHAIFDGMAAAVLAILAADQDPNFISLDTLNNAFIKIRKNTPNSSDGYTSWQLRDGEIATIAGTLFAGNASSQFSTRKVGAHSHRDNVTELGKAALALLLDHLVTEFPDYKEALENRWEDIRSHPNVLVYRDKLTNLSPEEKVTPTQNKMAFLRDLNRTSFVNHEIHINGRNFLTPCMIMGRLYDKFALHFADIVPTGYDPLLLTSFQEEETQFHTALAESVRQACDNSISTELTPQDNHNTAETYLREILRGASKAALHHKLPLDKLLKQVGITLSNLEHTLTPEERKTRRESPELTYGFTFDESEDPIQATLNFAKLVDNVIIEHDLYTSTIERQSIISLCNNFINTATQTNKREAPLASQALLTQIEQIKEKLLETLNSDENGKLTSKTLSEQKKQSLRETIAEFRGLDARIGKLTRAMAIETQLIDKLLKIRNQEPPEFSRLAVKAQETAFNALWIKLDTYLKKAESPANELEELYPDFDRAITRLKRLTEELPDLIEKCDSAIGEVNRKTKETHTPPQLLALSNSIVAALQKLKVDISLELNSDNTTSDLTNLIQRFEDLRIKKKTLLTPLRSAERAKELSLQLQDYTEKNQAAKTLQNTLVQLKGDFDIALGGPSFNSTDDASNESELLERMDAIFDPLNTRLEEAKEHYRILTRLIGKEDEDSLKALQDVTIAIHKAAYREASSFHGKKASALRQQSPGSPAHEYLAQQHNDLQTSYNNAASDHDSSEENSDSLSSQGNSTTNEQDLNLLAKQLVQLERGINDIRLKTSVCDKAIQEIRRQSASKPNRASNELIETYEQLKSDLVAKLQQDPPNTDIKNESKRLGILNEQKKTILEFVGFYVHARSQYNDLQKTSGNEQTKNELLVQMSYVTQQLDSGRENIAGRSGSLKTFKPVEIGQKLERWRRNRTTGIALASTFLPVFTAGAIAAAFFLPAVLTLVGAVAAVAVIALVGIIVGGIGIHLAHKNRVVRKKVKRPSKLTKDDVKPATPRSPSSSVDSNVSSTTESSTATTQGRSDSESSQPDTGPKDEDAKPKTLHP